MFKPLKDRVVILPDEIKNVTDSGIYIPDKDEKPTTGVVVVGNREVKKGDKVLFSKFGYDEVKEKGKSYFIVSDFNVLAIIK